MGRSRLIVLEAVAAVLCLAGSMVVVERWAAVLMLVVAGINTINLGVNVWLERKEVRSVHSLR